MSDKPGVALMVTLPEEIKDLLHIMAAKRILDNPKNRSTVAGIAREIILNYFKEEAHAGSIE